MSKVYFITHPAVTIEPDVPITDWSLSEQGMIRMREMLNQPWIHSIGYLFSSCEKKAIDGAQVLAQHLNLDSTPIAELGENDRSSTGYLPAAEFEATADAFFENYEDSIDGWETAIDAQKRIVQAVKSLLESTSNEGSIGIVSHGAVGTLLLCRLNGWQISRQHDQPGGSGGNFFVFDRHTLEVDQGWQPVDEVSAL